LPNNIILLVTIDKFDPNLVLVNINKLKPYKFLENITLQPILTKLNDLAIDELEPLLVEPKDLQLVEFEQVSNHLTPNSIKGTNVPIHYYHDVFVQDNNVTISDDQNDTFNNAIIDAYILGIFNPKGCIHS
jgi:hypothetical protein